MPPPAVIQAVVEPPVPAENCKKSFGNFKKWKEIKSYGLRDFISKYFVQNDF